jgi:hypothetical protein
MPRKPNYGFEKHRREQDRKAKKDAKLIERQKRREDAAASGDGSTQADGSGDREQPIPE